MYLFIWLVICILYHIFYNKLININKCFSEFCELLQQILNLTKRLWESPIYTLLCKSRGGRLGLVIGFQGGRTKFLTCGIPANSRELAPWLDHKTSVCIWRIGELADVGKNYTVGLKSILSFSETCFSFNIYMPSLSFHKMIVIITFCWSFLLAVFFMCFF